MKTPFWNSIGNVYWRRLLLTSIAVGAAWGCFAAFVPLKIHAWGTAIIGATSIFTGIMIRGSKWANDRNVDVPPQGEIR